MIRAILAATAAFGLFLAVPAALAVAEEPDGQPSGESTEPGPETPREKLPPPTRAEVELLISKLGSRVDSFYPARTKLRAYLDAEDNTVVLKALTDALPKVNKLQRFHIVRLLGDWGKPEGLALIAPYIDDKDDSVQRAAMSGVTRSSNPDPAVLPSLRALLSSNDDNVQKEAILSVGRMKDMASVPPLIEMLRGDNEGRRVNAHWALREISGKDFGMNADAWQDWWDFYQKEVSTKRKEPVSEDAITNRKPPPTNGPTREEQEAATGRFQLWMAGILGLVLLALPAAWAACRLWLRGRMNRLLKIEPAMARDPAVIAMRFAGSDHMPDWIVYPFLAGRMSKGSPLEVNIAMTILMCRLHGGCAPAAVSGGRLPRETPIPGAKERIVMFPRGLIADMAMAGFPAGRCLIRIAEPENPAWRRDPTAKEKLLAERHLASMHRRQPAT
ncbi:MAG TPA: HEAT repeat domain-containing protein [Planctomycetota bacterium]|nr:HEAT repeat domain-containing protein [Planctomycetota bacterium]